MKKTRRRLVLIVLATSLTLALASCAPATAPDSERSVYSPALRESMVATTAPTAESSPTAEASPVPMLEATAEKSPTLKPLVIEGFVRVADIDSTIVTDLRYATADNFTGQKVYPTDTCVLRLATAKKLAEASARVTALGYHIKVWDAYRPLSVQKIFWSIYPDSRYVANPSTGGSVHNRGCAVDVTLVNLDGDELVMPSAFDDFSSQASPGNPNMSAEARANLDVLRMAMINAGFNASTSEWWHFSDSDWRQFPVADVDLSRF